jgi:hypothetical protein
MILLGMLIFKGFTARRLYKSFDVRGLTTVARPNKYVNVQKFQNKAVSKDVKEEAERRYERTNGE